MARNQKAVLAALAVATAAVIAQAVVVAPAPAPLASTASAPYKDTTFSSQSVCEDYLAGGVHADDPWPSGAVDAAKDACCSQTIKKFDTANPGLKCQQAQFSFKCNGDKCPGHE